MVRRIALVAALVVAGATSVHAQSLTPDPVVAVYRLSYPIANRQGDVMNYVTISANNRRTYWNNVPQGLQLSPGLVTPPRTTFSRSRTIVQNGTEYSIDSHTGMVTASIPLNPAIPAANRVIPAANMAASPQNLPADPVVAVYRLSYPVVNRQGEVMNYVTISADNSRTYWNNVPQGLQLSPGFVTPPATTFSRSQTVVQNGTEYSIDSHTGAVTASIQLPQATTTAKVPLPNSAPAPEPAPAPAPGER